MAATTLKAIIDRFQVVLEGADLNLKKSTEEFTFDRQPNTTIDNAYRIVDEGLDESSTLTNNLETRRDLLGVMIARRAGFDSQANRETLETTLNTIERKLVADGPSNSYHARIEGRPPMARPDDGEVIMAGVTLSVDYDFSLT